MKVGYVHFHVVRVQHKEALLSFPLRSTIGDGRLGFRVSEQNGSLLTFLNARRKFLFAVFGMRTGEKVLLHFRKRLPTILKYEKS